MAVFTVSIFQGGVGSVNVGDGTLLANLSVSAGRGPKGDGFTGGSFNASTGVVTFTSNDGLGFATDDLRGDLSDVDITGGTIDGTVIGGSTPAAISGTTGSFSGNLTVDTNTLFVNAANNRVGVGTASPASPLHVVGPAGFVGTFDGATDTRIDFRNSGTRNGIIQSSSGSFSFNANTAIPLTFLTSSTERLRITSTGNVGIGTSSPDRRLHISGTDFLSSTMRFTRSASSFDLGLGADGRFAVTSSPSNIEAMAITQTGNVGIGTSSPVDVSGFKSVTASGSTGAFFDVQAGATSIGRIVGSAAAFNIAALGSVPMTFQVNSAERLRIDASGNLLVGTTTNLSDPTRAVFVTGANQTTLAAYAATTNLTNAVAAFYSNVGGTQTARCVIRASGNLENINNSYGALSDAKLKENVTDATPKLDKLNQVRVVSFNRIGDEQKQIGVIAQELEQIFPSMVEGTPDRDAEGNDLGTTTKSVKYSVFVPMLIKAMQEQQAIIEALEARITALEV